MSTPRIPLESRREVFDEPVLPADWEELSEDEVKALLNEPAPAEDPDC